MLVAPRKDTMKTLLRNRVAALLASTLLAASALVAAPALSVAPASSASAAWGTCIQVGQVNQPITVLKMNGTYQGGGQGWWTCDVNKVYVYKNTFMAIGGYIYYGGSQGYWQQISQKKVYYITTNVA